MSRLGKMVSMLALAAAAAVLGLSVMVFTQPAEAGTTVSTTTLLHGARGGRGYCGQAGLEAAAEALGMTADQLSTQLWGGKSLADLAEEAGVDLQDVQDAVTEACQAATREAIEQAVTDGTITRDHADWLLEGLEKGYWGRGSGFGFGPRGFGGHFGPFRPLPDATSTPAPGSNS